MWLVTRIDSPSETSAGSMLTGSDEAAKTMVPPCWGPPPAPPPDPFSSPRAAAAARARAHAHRVGRGREDDAPALLGSASSASPRSFLLAASRRGQCQRGPQDEQANNTWTLQCTHLPPGPPPSAAGICQIGPHGGAWTQCLSPRWP